MTLVNPGRFTTEDQCLVQCIKAHKPHPPPTDDTQVDNPSRTRYTHIITLYNVM